MKVLLIGFYVGPQAMQQQRPASPLNVQQQSTGPQGTEQPQGVWGSGMQQRPNVPQTTQCPQGMARRPVTPQKHSVSETNTK